MWHHVHSKISMNSFCRKKVIFSSFDRGLVTLPYEFYIVFDRDYIMPYCSLLNVDVIMSNHKDAEEAARKAQRAADEARRRAREADEAARRLRR